MEPDVADMAMLIGLIFILPVVFAIKAVKFIVEPLPYLIRKIKYSVLSLNFVFR